MKSLDVSRNAISIGLAAAFLAGCGGSQPPIGAPGAMPPSRAIAMYADRTRSWMLSDAKSGDLLYVSNWLNGTVTVYSYTTLKLVGSLRGFNHPSGLCVDKSGDVFVADYNNGRVVEYAHGATKPMKKLAAPDGPNSCSVDPTTGDLAVTNGAFGAAGNSNLAVYRHARGVAREYTDGKFIVYFWFCSYDNKGNIFVDGTNGTQSYSEELAELPRGGQSFTNLNFYGAPSVAPGGLQWDNKSGYLVFNPILYGSFVDKLSIAGSQVTTKGTTAFFRADLVQFWLEPRRKIIIGTGGDSRSDYYAVSFWRYPHGGYPIATITDHVDGAFGVTVSLAK